MLLILVDSVVEILVTYFFLVVGVFSFFFAQVFSFFFVDACSCFFSSNLLVPTSGGCRTKLQYLAAVVVPAPFLCRTPPPPPRGEAEDAPRGDPAPTLVALAAGPEKSGISTKKLKLHDK